MDGTLSEYVPVFFLFPSVNRPLHPICQICPATLLRWCTRRRACIFHFSSRHNTFSKSHGNRLTWSRLHVCYFRRYSRRFLAPNPGRPAVAALASAPRLCPFLAPARGAASPVVRAASSSPVKFAVKVYAVLRIDAGHSVGLTPSS